MPAIGACSGVIWGGSRGRGGIVASLRRWLRYGGEASTNIIPRGRHTHAVSGWLPRNRLAERAPRARPRRAYYMTIMYMYVHVYHHLSQITSSSHCRYQSRFHWQSYSQLDRECTLVATVQIDERLHFRHVPFSSTCTVHECTVHDYHVGIDSISLESSCHLFCRTVSQLLFSELNYVQDPLRVLPWF